MRNGRNALFWVLKMMPQHMFIHWQRNYLHTIHRNENIRGKVKNLRKNFKEDSLMNLLYIAVKVRIQVHPLRISKQNILVKNENMTEKKFLSNIILLKSLLLILQVK